ncbi:MAG: nitroreductase [Eubacteriales bacterium]|nr:nitroreductase [Eubacteriales bacterium]
MKETIKDLLERRSIRSYKQAQIKKDELDAILQCGVYAPTAMGMQSPLLVAVQDAAKVKTLSKMNGAVWGKDMDPFYGAPTVVIVLAERDNPNSVQDASLVMGNLMNAAHALGLGSCWINRAKEMFELEDGRALLRSWGVDDKYMGVGICALGYIEGAYPQPKPRKAGYVLYAD